MMARKKAENGQELPDIGSPGAEELAAETAAPAPAGEEAQTETAAPETEETQEEAASPDTEQLPAEAADPDINQLSMKTEAPEAEEPAAGEKKETWYRVTTKNPVTKKIGPIQFVEGKALVPSSERWMLTWFQEHGYRIEKAE